MSSNKQELSTRSVRVGNISFLVPPYIYRMNKGWCLMYPGYHSVFFADNTYGASLWSLRACIDCKLELLRQKHGRLPYGQGKAHNDALMSYKKIA
jgi:hypothetical protein